jgi:hypothetical protein
VFSIIDDFFPVDKNIVDSRRFLFFEWSLHPVEVAGSKPRSPPIPLHPHHLALAGSSHPEALTVGDAQDFLAVRAEVDITFSERARQSPAVHLVQDGTAMRADRSLIVFFSTVNHASSSGNFFFILGNWTHSLASVFLS